MPPLRDFRGVLGTCVKVWTFCYTMPGILILQILGSMQGFTMADALIVIGVLLLPSVPTAFVLWLFRGHLHRYVAALLGAFAGFAAQSAIFALIMLGSDPLRRSAFGSTGMGMILVGDANFVRFLVFTAIWTLPVSILAGALSGFWAEGSNGSSRP